MLTPTVVSHWSDGKRIHVIGYFGGRDGDVYLQSEDGINYGTKVQWPHEVKSSKPVIYISSGYCVLNDINKDSKSYYLAAFQGVVTVDADHPDLYIQLYARVDEAEADDEQDLANIAIPFYAIFHKF